MCIARVQCRSSNWNLRFGCAAIVVQFALISLAWGDEADRRAVSAWLEAAGESEFVGTMTYHVRLNLPADPARESDVVAYEREMNETRSEFEARMRAAHASDNRMGSRAREQAIESHKRLLSEYTHAQRTARLWATEGVRIMQSWRVDVAGEHSMRVEAASRIMTPPNPYDDPIVFVHSIVGGRRWSWAGRLTKTASTRPDDASGESSKLPAARRTVGLFMTGGASEWAGSDIESVERDGDVIVATLSSPGPTPDDPAASTRLSLRAADDGLQLIRAESVRGDQYVTTSFSEYRVRGDGAIPDAITERHGPLAEQLMSDEEVVHSTIEAYQIADITFGISDEVRRDFAKPPVPETDASGRPKYRPTYADVTPSGREAFLPPER